MRPKHTGRTFLEGLPVIDKRKHKGQSTKSVISVADVEKRLELPTSRGTPIVSIAFLNALVFFGLPTPMLHSL